MGTTTFTKKSLGLDTTEPAVTPLTTGVETTFAKKPKLAINKSKKKDIPEGLWTKCEKCDTMIINKELDENLKVCPHCQFHFRMGARDRIQSLVDPDSFGEIDVELSSVDALNFTGKVSYIVKLADNRKRTGERDAAITGFGGVGGHRAGVGVMDFDFLGGSMGSVVGEKLTRLIEKSTEKSLPVIIISASGGARMYEGMFSLMQMAKTCGALAYHAKRKLPFFSVLTNPTFAGVMASFATVGNIIIAEPGAAIGFAGSRVIKDTTQAELPPGFQTAEFLLDRGLIDAIVPRKDLKRQLGAYLEFVTASRNGAAAA